MRRISLNHIHGQLGQVVHQLCQSHFSQFRSPQGWQPAVNAYRLNERIVVCVDLAGVDRSHIDLHIHEATLVLRGRRAPPEPELRPHEKAMQVIALEIDHGNFERQLVLPPEVEETKVSAEYQNGFLWINLPLRSQA